MEPSPLELLKSVANEFGQRTGLVGIESEVRDRFDGPVLMIDVANPTERLFRVLEEVRALYARDGELPLATLRRRKKPNLLQSAEGRLLLRTLSESLNINRYSFKDDFFGRYSKSVFSAEEQVTAAANHIVFGRRGAGKSSLLLYAMHTRTRDTSASVWVDMQAYAQRSDLGVVADLLREIVHQAQEYIHGAPGVLAVISELSVLTSQVSASEAALRKLLPNIRRLFSSLATRRGGLAVFLDDFHVVGMDLQPKLLGMLYAIARGNNIFLKLSAIETLTKTSDADSRTGMQIPHDLQEIKLDYNLTIPEKATSHITSILDAHALYCGIPSIKTLCTSGDVLSRLVWVAAGVPRDALNLFAQAMTKASVEDRKQVSVSNVNVAASDTLNPKLRELETDAYGVASELHNLLEAVREFCVENQRTNAFLVEIRTGDHAYQHVRKLIDLRLLHVINEGVSVGKAGQRYMALILDYGFYIGFRAAKSVDLFNKQTRKVSRKELRRLPIFAPK